MSDLHRDFGKENAYLHFTSVKELRWVIDETASPVTLHTSDDVVRVTLDTLGDDTETVVLHRGAAADTAEQTLLDTLLELDDRDTRRRGSDLDGDLADSQPGDTNTAGGGAMS